MPVLDMTISALLEQLRLLRESFEASAAVTPREAPEIFDFGFASGLRYCELLIANAEETLQTTALLGEINRLKNEHPKIADRLLAAYRQGGFPGV